MKVEEPAAIEAQREGFADFGLDAGLLDSLSELGYEEPTPIQREAIPPLLAGRDVLAEAPTGTGKTAAFALPLLQRMERSTSTAPTALILVPTRELAMQVAQAVHRYGRGVDARVLPIYGGQAIGQQLGRLRRGVDVVVATPGRAVDHLKRGSLELDRVRYVVLDEADEMLDMGFADDLEAILKKSPVGRQTALFSATISAGIARIASRHLRDPVRVTVARELSTHEGRPLVRQVAYVVQRSHKLAALSRILDVEAPTSVLIFARTRLEVDELTEALGGRGYDAAALHGGLVQEQRDRVMSRFRDGSIQVLVATDVAARGLDIEQVSHVVNYDVPSDPEAYLHRIGRTGRAGRRGVAVTLVEPREQRLLRNIERLMKRDIEIARLPTVADLRARRFELLDASLREVLLNEDLDRYRAVVEPLEEEYDILDIALAAASLAAEATGPDRDEVELPDMTFRPQDRLANLRPPRGPRGARSFRDGAGMTKLFIGGGREIGLRPADIVGAIANESGLSGKAIGAIEIADHFALVEVPEEAADDVIRALNNASIRGRRLPVRRQRDRA
ncbi:MAG TPA: DEAD/DEAH box helicase [Candidatus Limnocylindrales bacterium]|nr:DEAD/DEAH box helicase [Candidatus Limnocylindrales bacterium]